MIAKLQEISDIKTGITFRNRLLDNIQGEVEVIQMKDVGMDCTISDRLMRVSGDLVKEKHLLQPGSIIFLAKGRYTRACLITDPSRRWVVSSAFFSLRVKNPIRVLPSYLQWYLNLPLAEQYFRTQASGTSMFSLPMSVLKNLEIPVPPPEIQQQVVKIVETRQQERVALQLLEDKRDEFIRELLLEQIGKS